jgi:hypothetical protein
VNSSIGVRFFPSLFLWGSRMSDHPSIARDLLRQLLAVGPQKGSRLKVLLAREFEKRTGTTFQQAFWNFQKFSAFLAANADLLDIVPPDGPGDITIRLRQASVFDLQPLSHPPPVGRFLPPPVWNAFTNPDPRRRRFFHRFSGEISHYIEASQEPPNPKIAATVATDPNYLEIHPVSAEQQSFWLKEFLASVPIPENKQQVLKALAATPYSSAVNTAFMATLGVGEFAESWRQFRAARVQEAVRGWADRCGVPFDQVFGLLAPPNQMMTERSMRQETATPATQESPSTQELRNWLHSLIDHLSAADVSQILLPASTVFKLTTRRS